MPRHFIRLAVLFTSGIGLFAPRLAAQDKAENPIPQQKSTAEAHLKKAGITKTSHLETDDLLIYATIPDNRLTPISEQMQKTLAFSREALQLTTSEAKGPGKITVYLLTDAIQFSALYRAVEMRRPEKGATQHLNLRSEIPYVMVSPEIGQRVNDADLATAASAALASAVLTKKAGVNAAIPAWLSTGFGVMAANRADPSPAKLSAYKSRLKAAAVGTRARPALIRMTDIWSGQKTKDSDMVSASFVEFLLYGPGAEKFPQFLASFRPSDDQPEPSTWGALGIYEWKSDETELAWKQWIARMK